MSAHSISQVRAAKAKALKVFGKLAPVVGVGITKIGASYGLKINLDAPPASDVTLPTKVAGVPVQVEIVGRIRKR